MDVSYRTTLELDKIIARAVQLCTCAETKEMMRAIEPFATTEEERYALAQTNAINALLLKNGSPRFGAVHEVRRVVAHAAKGGILSMGELLEIAAALRNFSGLAQWYGLTDHDMLPTDDLFICPGSSAGCMKSRSASASFRRKKWPIPPPLPCATCAARSARPRTASAPSWMPSSKTLPPTNFCRMLWFPSATAAMLCRFVPSTAVKSAASSTMVSSTGSTVFVEPTAVVEANARIMQLHAQEQEEITRILTGRSLARWHRLSRSSATAMTLCCKLTCCWPKPALRWSRTPLCRR